MSNNDNQNDSEAKEYSPETSYSVTSSEVDMGAHTDAMDFGPGPMIEPSEVSA